MSNNYDLDEMFAAYKTAVRNAAAQKRDASRALRASGEYALELMELGGENWFWAMVNSEGCNIKDVKTGLRAAGWKDPDPPRKNRLTALCNSFAREFPRLTTDEQNEFLRQVEEAIT